MLLTLILTSTTVPIVAFLLSSNLATATLRNYERLGTPPSTTTIQLCFWVLKYGRGRKPGVFGAVAVLWEKDQGTGNITLREAFDFGTEQLSQASRSAWNNAAVNALPNRLPPVLPAAWKCPAAPANAPAPVAYGQAQVAHPAWELVLPKDQILYRTPSDSMGGPLLSTLPAIAALPDFRFDLKEYQEQIDVILD